MKSLGYISSFDQATTVDRERIENNVCDIFNATERIRELEDNLSKHRASTLSKKPKRAGGASFRNVVTNVTHVLHFWLGMQFQNVEPRSEKKNRYLRSVKYQLRPTKEYSTVRELAS